jgi:hypothetical protein
MNFAQFGEAVISRHSKKEIQRFLAIPRKTEDIYMTTTTTKIKIGNNSSVAQRHWTVSHMTVPSAPGND